MASYKVFISNINKTTQEDFEKFLNDNFGEGKMAECIEYLLRLKKMA